MDIEELFAICLIAKSKGGNPCLFKADIYTEEITLDMNMNNGCCLECFHFRVPCHQRGTQILRFTHMYNNLPYSAVTESFTIFPLFPFEIPLA